MQAALWPGASASAVDIRPEPGPAGGGLAGILPLPASAFNAERVERGLGLTTFQDLPRGVRRSRMPVLRAGARALGEAVTVGGASAKVLAAAGTNGASVGPWPTNRPPVASAEPGAAKRMLLNLCRWAVCLRVPHYTRSEL